MLRIVQHILYPVSAAHMSMSNPKDNTPTLKNKILSFISVRFGDSNPKPKHEILHAKTTICNSSRIQSSTDPCIITQGRLSDQLGIPSPSVMFPHTTSHHATPHHTTPNHTKPHQTTPYHTTPHYTTTPSNRKFKTDVGVAGRAAAGLRAGAGTPCS